jgi:hypothetical protein
MTVELPEFDEKKNYVLSGKTLNQLVAAIKASQIIQVDGAEIERTPEGVKIKF